MTPAFCVSAVFTCEPRASTVTVSPRLPTSNADGADRETLASAENDVLALERTKAGQLDPHRVPARLEVGDLEVALIIGHGGARIARRLVHDGDCRTRDDGPLRVHDRAGDAPVTVCAADPSGNTTAAARHKRSIRKTLVRNFNIDRPPENAG